MSDDRTLKEAQQQLRQNWEKGTTCECCGQHVKLYKRPMHSTMAAMLLKLYRFDKANPGQFCHVGQLMFKGQTATSDFEKLSHWGLVKLMERDPNDTTKRTSGQWAITEKGRQFCRNEITINSHVLIYNKVKRGETGEQVGIHDVLGKKYDYREIMGDSFLGNSRQFS